MLNRIYRIIFNRATDSHNAMSEMSRSNDKSAGKDTSICIDSTFNLSTGKQTLRLCATSTAIAAILGLATITSSYAKIAP